MHPKVPTEFTKSPNDLLARNEDAMALASWISFHLLKPVHPANDAIWQVMPWREDVDVWDQQAKVAFLDEPHDYDLDISEDTTDSYDPELPLLIKAFQAMESGGLSTAVRYHFFELASNPRMGDAGRILSTLADILISGDRCIQGKLKRAYQFGRFVVGPLGIIEKVERETTFDFLGDFNALAGTLHEFSVLIQECAHSSVGIFEEPLFDLETIGWSSQWSQWFGKQDFVLPSQDAGELKVIAMLGFRKHWHPDSSKKGITDRVPLVRLKTLASLQNYSRQELEGLLRQLLPVEKPRILESSYWMNAAQAEIAVKNNDFGNLDSASLQQLLLLMDQRVLTNHFHSDVH